MVSFPSDELKVDSWCKKRGLYFQQRTGFIGKKNIHGPV
jgi:hypothetical protein